MTESTAKKQAKGRFAPGQSGNPAGRPVGSRNKATIAAEQILDGEAEKLMQKAVDMALQGDTVALRICLDRIAAPRKDRTVKFDLPPISSPADAEEALKAVLIAVAEGEMSPAEGAMVSSLIEKFLRIERDRAGPAWDFGSFPQL